MLLQQADGGTTISQSIVVRESDRLQAAELARGDYTTEFLLQMMDGVRYR